jgi:hypothetical protein
MDDTLMLGMRFQRCTEYLDILIDPYYEASTHALAHICGPGLWLPRKRPCMEAPQPRSRLSSGGPNRKVSGHVWARCISSEDTTIHYEMRAQSHVDALHGG